MWELLGYVWQEAKITALLQSFLKTRLTLRWLEANICRRLCDRTEETVFQEARCHGNSTRTMVHYSPASPSSSTAVDHRMTDGSVIFMTLTVCFIP
jgi:hypothetical protein